MPLPVYRLRRWLAAIAIIFTLVVASMYLSVRFRQRNILKEVPNKIGIDIKQTATGFQFSKSEGGRTLFTIQASNLKQFKLNGQAELHNVSIVLYGRDSSRFDRIYGDDFKYDPQSGDITANGDVQIDLEANPSGAASPDQSTPKELKNPIHFKTRDLVFNKESGDASTKARVEFRTAQTTGSAVGVSYTAKTNTLRLESQVHAEIEGPHAGKVDALRGFVTRDPRQIVLDHPRLIRSTGVLNADEATFVLGADNNVDKILAKGNVNAEAKRPELKRHRAGGAEMRSAAANNFLADHSSSHEASIAESARADEAELTLTGKKAFLQTAILKGNVRLERIAAQSLEAAAQQAVFEFSGKDELRKVRAERGVRISQQAAAGDVNSSQTFELTAPAIEFFVAQGRRLDRAITSGDSQISIGQNSGATSSPANSTTVVTAGRFEAHFQATSTGSSRLATIHGSPDAKIVNSVPGQPDRISTSQSVEAVFLPQGGMESITQQGSVAYSDQQTAGKRVEASADRARYTPADQMLVLTGSPRVTNVGMFTTATSIRINRATGDAIAEGDVKSTYSELKEQPEGALLASSSPIHVTARTMTAHSTPAIAIYSGKARLWQDANVIEAPSIQFDREHRSVIAQGTSSQPVSTILLQPAKHEKTPPRDNSSSKRIQSSGVLLPIAITGRKLTYIDSERKARYEGGIVAKGQDFTASADAADLYLTPGTQGSHNERGQLDRMVAQGHILIQAPNRRAEGQTLTYTPSDDKFVLTGGPPSIFDAERGKITGVSLTFFRHDDRVLVEGEASSPVVTETRVAQ